jgi:diaminopimelate epimerase
MHGLGNDFLLIDRWEHNNIQEDLISRLASILCKRRYAIGADGLIIILKPSLSNADVKMRIFNADGSEAEMCGNGIRCLAKYVYEHNILQKKHYNVETLSGLKAIEVEVINEKVKNIKVNMGKYTFDRKKIPMAGNGTFIDEELTISESIFKASCVSVGNPHCVIFVQYLEEFPVKKWGPLIEKHNLFPNRINVEFVENIDYNRIKMRVWERGSGETQACGTGACAVMAVAHKLGKVGDVGEIILQGGTLKVTLTNGELILEGPVTKVYQGLVSDEVLSSDFQIL